MIDISDFVGNVEQFPVLSKWNFLNHAGVTPMPTLVADAVRATVNQCVTDAYLDTDWFADIAKVRIEAARLVNADLAEIALVKNTSEAVSIVAQGLDWQPGDRMVTANIEYPANVYPWMEAARKFGLELVMVPEETDRNGRRQVFIETIIAELEKPRTRLLTLSHVEFASGQRHDLATLGQFCRERGILFFRGRHSIAGRFTPRCESNEYRFPRCLRSQMDDGPARSRAVLHPPGVAGARPPDRGRGQLGHQ